MHSSGRRIVGAIGENGIVNAIYVNFPDEHFVFFMFTNVHEFEPEVVFKELRSRILGFLDHKLYGDRVRYRIACTNGLI
ncbi:MAG: hypothetical protein HY287_14720 [Planctomycetes bacterium]|nr:hypothetical protein [Planctomycetota bacterium]MBI3835577.1 hypothetical protein [Planctomycetota bacterium]